MREIDRSRNSFRNHSSSTSTTFMKKRCNKHSRKMTKLALNNGEEVIKNRPKETAWDIT